jgi:hypothetical protein
MKIKIMQIGLKTLGIITTGLNRGVHSHQHTKKKNINNNNKITTKIKLS